MKPNVNEAAKLYWRAQAEALLHEYGLEQVRKFFREKAKDGVLKIDIEGLASMPKLSALEIYFDLVKEAGLPQEVADKTMVKFEGDTLSVIHAPSERTE